MLLERDLQRSEEIRLLGIVNSMKGNNGMQKKERAMRLLIKLSASLTDQIRELNFKECLTILEILNKCKEEELAPFI